MRHARGSLRRMLPLAVAALAAMAIALTAQAAVARPAAAPCNATQLSGKVREGSGAAGTLAVSIAVRNTSPAACRLRGFPKLKLHNAAGSLPTHVLHGGVALLNHAVSTVTLQPGKSASLLVTYSDVPTGTETSCKHATRLVIILGHGQGLFSIAFDASPCNHGTLHESPFLAGIHHV